MLTRTDIENLIRLDMPEDEARRLLLTLVPERVDLDVMRMLIEVMRETAAPVSGASDVLDCCGTGGSGLPHFNVSTAVAFVLAAGGVRVVKFGNRAATSRSGSFDLLELVGIPNEFPLDRIDETLDRTNLVFLFAPQCYPALKRLSMLRKSLGTRTIFNFLGPLLHPLKPKFRVLGVSNPRMHQLTAHYLAAHSDTERALVVHGADGADELTVHGGNRMFRVEAGKHEFEYFHGNGKPTGEMPALRLGLPTPSENFRIFQGLVSGDDTESVHYEQVCLNAGAGFVVAGKVGSIADGIKFAAELFAAGKVSETVEKSRKVYADIAR